MDFAAPILTGGQWDTCQHQAVKKLLLQVQDGANCLPDQIWRAGMIVEAAFKYLHMALPISVSAPAAERLYSVMFLLHGSWTYR